MQFAKAPVSNTSPLSLLENETSEKEGRDIKMWWEAYATYLLAVLWRASFGAVMPDRAIIFSGGGPPCGCLRIIIVSPDRTYKKHMLLLES